jgi:plastocyanin
MRAVRRLLTLVAVLALAACSTPRPAPTPVVSTPAPAPAATCPASATITPTGGNVEMRGVGTSLYALFFLPADSRITAGQEVKIVWRMTGAGDLTIDATNDRNTVTKPVWGPEAHGGSSYRRPGDEWGTGWVFPSAGCWTVHATRATDGSATLKLRVA